MMVIIFALVMLLIPLMKQVRLPVRFTPLAVGVVVAFSVVLITPMITFLLFRRKIQRSLRRQLIDIGKPVCLICGYDLRGQTVPRCPECGTGFDEKLLPRPESQNDPP